MPQEIKKIQKPISNLVSKASPFHIEIDKAGAGFLISASGIKRIAELTESKISLKFNKGTLGVSGANLSLSLYEDKTVEISGKLEVIEFGYTKN